jgi:O-antigen ligase
MNVSYPSRHSTGLQTRLQRALTLAYTLVLSALAAIEPMVAAIFEINPVRQCAMLVVLIFLMVIGHPKLLVTRESALYTFFTAFMFITLIWTPSIADGMNTLLPALSFILLSILFGSLVAFYDLGGVLAGTLGGFVFGALLYTKVAGFPFVYPDDFSYNTFAGMYLFGLFITLLFGWYTRLKLLPLMIAVVVMLHIAATTSIKTNLGIVLGALAAALMYAGSFLRVLRRNVVLLSIVVTALVFGVISNDALRERVQNGFDRVSRGAEILQRREDVAGNTSFEDRADWQNLGLKGWARSPLFGNGVEAFRTDNGVTSHSTPIDILYNTGVIGFVVFYAIFVSLGVRLVQVRGSALGSLPALIFAGLICYSFITLSGTMHYNTFMAIFFAVSAGLLRRYAVRSVRAPAAVEAHK